MMGWFQTGIVITGLLGASGGISSAANVPQGHVTISIWMPSRNILEHSALQGGGAWSISSTGKPHHAHGIRPDR